MASQNEHSAGRIILVVVGLLVLAAMAYFATRYFATRHKSEAQALTIAELREELPSLKAIS
ncbi:MAG: hypothetical protein R3B47_21050 [Bacteroidia bacterium]